MKKVFMTSFMYAPKATGKTGGNQTTATDTPKTDTTVINAENGQPNEQTELVDEGSKEGEKEGGEGETATTVVEEPTSEKLLSIRAEIEAKMNGLMTEPDMKKKLAIVEQVQKLQADEKAEQAAIKKAILDEQIAAKRNARIALVDAVINASNDLLAFMLGEYAAAPVDENGSKGAEMIEKSNVLNDALKAAREVVVNELIGKPAKLSGDKPAGEGSTGEKGETSAKIIARYEELLGEGKTDTDARKTIISEGFSRGTTGAVVLAYRREKGLAD